MSDIHAIRRHSAEIIISSRPMTYVMFHHKRGVTHTEEFVTHRKACHTKKGWHTKGATHMWIKHEINILLQKLDWWQKNRRKRRKSYNLLHQQRTNYIRESQLAKRGITRTTVWVRRPRRKFNCELHEIKFKQLIADAYMRFQRYKWEVYTLMENDGGAVQTLSHTWKYYFAMNQNSELSTTQRHHRESDDKYASGNRQPLTHTSDHWWKAK